MTTFITVLIALMVYVGSYAILDIFGIIYNWKNIKYVKQLFYPWGNIGDDLIAIMSIIPIYNTLLVIAMIVYFLGILVYKMFDKIGVVKFFKKIGSIEINKHENHRD